MAGLFDRAIYREYPVGYIWLMGSTLQQVVLVVAILGGSAVVTNLFARAMYISCAKCGTLNARRRVVCRTCGDHLRKNKSQV